MFLKLYNPRLHLTIIFSLYSFTTRVCIALTKVVVGGIIIIDGGNSYLISFLLVDKKDDGNILGLSIILEVIA